MHTWLADDSLTKSGHVIIEVDEMPNSIIFELCLF